jgi:ABC-2 type transport system ATP-binding protein
MLSIRNIVKQYANHRALDDVSIEIEHGKIFGLLGPNGAGKTSLIRIINQITAPDGGEILINGEKLNPSHIAQIGYLPEERGLYKKMEIGEQMLYLARLKGMSKEEATKKIKFWFEKMEMQTWWNKKVEDLSKGMQQKVQFVATVVHEPQLIILDEPFSGFDPVNAEIITQEILELNKNGATIIFSTHRMESVEQLCDHIALIHKSHKILDGSVKQIKNSYRNNTYKIEYHANGTDIRVNEGLFEMLSQHDTEEGRQVTLKIKNGNTSNDVLSYLIPQVQITQMTEVIPSINEIFIQQVTALN